MSHALGKLMALNIHIKVVLKSNTNIPLLTMKKGQKLQNKNRRKTIEIRHMKN